MFLSPSSRPACTSSIQQPLIIIGSSALPTTQALIFQRNVVHTTWRHETLTQCVAKAQCSLCTPFSIMALRVIVPLTGHRQRECSSFSFALFSSRGVHFCIVLLQLVWFTILDFVSYLRLWQNSLEFFTITVLYSSTVFVHRMSYAFYSVPFTGAGMATKDLDIILWCSTPLVSPYLRNVPRDWYSYNLPSQARMYW